MFIHEEEPRFIVKSHPKGTFCTAGTKLKQNLRVGAKLIGVGAKLSTKWSSVCAVTACSHD